MKCGKKVIDLVLEIPVYVLNSNTNGSQSKWKVKSCKRSNKMQNHYDLWVNSAI